MPAREADPGPCPGENSVVELFASDVAAARRAELGAHVDRCASCRQLVAIVARGHVVSSLMGSRLRFGTGGSAGSAATFPAADAADLSGRLAPGDELGRYRIEGLLGQGGMGVVYAARDPELDRRVAVKVIRPGLAAYGDVVAARLSREARAMAQVTHPNVITVHDVGQAGGQVFLAMELVHGQTLRAWLESGSRPWRDVLDRFRAAGEGLAAAHAAKLVHRDFKPDNVLVDPTGRVRVTDFGLARALADRQGETVVRAVGTIDDGRAVVDLTHTGAAIGTPAYMAPEQHAHLATDARSDQFSFCVALWEAMYGQRPFAGDTPLELAGSVLGGRVRTPPRRPRRPVWLRRALQRGLSLRPEERFPSMRELLDAIRPRRSRLPLAAAIGVAAVCAGAIAFGAVFDRAGSPDCSAPADKVAQFWSPARREQLRLKMATTPVGQARYELVQNALDRYAESWRRMATEVCGAAERGESAELVDLRTHCLESRLSDLDQTISILETDDPLLSTGDVRWVDQMPTVERCSAVEAVEARVPLPSDPGERAKVDELRRDVYRADALRQAGRYGEARALIEELHRRAEPLNYRPIMADILYYRGWLEVSTGRAADGEAILRQAAHTAEAGRYDQLAADAWIVLIETAAQSTGDLTRAADYAEHARAALDRLGSPVRLRAMYEHHMGILDWARSRHSDALVHFGEARRLFEKLGDEDEVLAADEGVALVRGEQGELEESLRMHRRVLAGREQLHGPDHPTTALSYNNVASTLADMGRNEEALVEIKRALAIYERVNGPEHADTAQMLHNVGELDRTLGRYQEALEYHRRALAILEREHGSEHQTVANSLENTGGVYLDLGRIDEAMPRLQRAYEMFRHTLGDDHLDTVRAMVNLGEGLRQARRPAEALELDQKAIAVVQRQIGMNNLYGAHTQLGMGLDLVALRRAAEARPILESAIATFQNIGADPSELAHAKFGLAEALWTVRADRDGARQVAAEAKQLLTGRPGSDRLRAEIHAWIAARGP